MSNPIPHPELADLEPQMIAEPRAGRRFFFGWWVLLAATVGQFFGGSNMLLFSLGVFTRPLQAEFGWSRAQIAFGATIVVWGMAVLSPLQGYLVDRFGTRRINLLTMPFFGLSLASLYFLPPDIRVYYAAWFVFILFGIVLWTGPYNKVVAAWFDRRLGLALGITNAGQGLGTIFIQPYALWLISSFGWRWAYVGMGLIMVVPFLFNLLLLRDNPADRNLLADGEEASDGSTRGSESVTAGFTIRECARRQAFWLILAAFLLLGFLGGFVATGQVPMLIDRGISPAKATSIAAIFGLGVVIARLSVGWLIDHFFAPYVMIGSMLCPLVGLLMYATGDASDAVFLWAALIGFGIGAENDLLGFCVARYFGRKAYGKLYGIYIASFQFGVGLTAVALGAVRTAYGSYAPGLLALAGGIVLVMILCARMGPYTFQVQPAE